ncbi:MAG: NAD-dependent epimerase/dehydratase family protein [Candidatus Falkowbacteria bacterium]
MPKRAIFDKKNVLVAGGAGFIGSHLCDRLIEDNKVICIDSFITGNERNIDHLLKNENFAFIRADINELTELETLPELQKFKIQFQGIQEIYNCACPASPAHFDENRIATLLANSVGLKNLLTIAVKYKSQFVHFSSSVVYGPRREGNVKIKEDDKGVVDFIGKRSAYDEGKRFAESMVLNYRDVHNISVRVARLFRTYGPRMPLNDQQMLPDFIFNALDNKDVIIHGDENFTSSFCYVSDAIDAIIKLVQSDYQEPINIGSDIEESLTDLAKKVIALTSSQSQITYEDPILFMTPLSIPDIALVKDKLGWMPITTLDKGLEKTVENLRASKGLVGIENVV